MKVWLNSVLLSIALGLTGCGGSGASVSAPDGGGASAGVGTGAGTGADVGDGTGTGDAGGGTGIGSGEGTASGPSDSGGVGSGGTGISADAAGIGSADGWGSIIVNGVRFNTDATQTVAEDVAGLELGMTVIVRGSVDATLQSGVATHVLSVPELRGPVTAVNAAAGWFEVVGVRVSVDDATLYAGLSGLDALKPEQNVQVHALPESSGRMRATRVQWIAAATTQRMWGSVQGLNRAAKSFQLNGMAVSYGQAHFASGWSAAALSDGVPVYVQGVPATGNGAFVASEIRRGHGLPDSTNSPVVLLGIVENFNSPQLFTLQGVRVNAATAQITGGPASSIGNGVKLDVVGRMVQGELMAERLRIRHVPGTGGPVVYEATGPVAQYQSLSNFRVNGQLADASGSNVSFVNGTSLGMRNGVRVRVSGSKVLEGVLVVTQVEFL